MKTLTATNRRKAVAIAKDVVAQLRLKRLKASPGDYCRVEYDHMYEYFEDSVNRKDSFQKTFKKNKKVSCRVCAMGAVFIGYINRFNKVTNDEVNDPDPGDIIELVDDVFSEFQLRLMEMAFEGEWQDTKLVEDFSEKEQENMERKAEQYYRKYPDPDQRLRAIMLNVVRNNGEFVLPKRMK